MFWISYMRFFLTRKVIFYYLILGKLHKGARCFLRKVKLGGLRWGGETPKFCAPTQIDDARFESDPNIGNSLLKRIAHECEYFGYIDL